MYFNLNNDILMFMCKCSCINGLLPFFHGGTLQQTATSTSCSPCGKNAGTLIRAWCTTFASENADHSSPGDRKLWRRRSSAYSRKDFPLVKLPGASRNYIFKYPFHLSHLQLFLLLKNSIKSFKAVSGT